MTYSAAKKREEGKRLWIGVILVGDGRWWAGQVNVPTATPATFGLEPCHFGRPFYPTTGQFNIAPFTVLALTTFNRCCPSPT